MLSREAIFAVKSTVVPLDVPEWGGAVGIRKLTLKERDGIAALPDDAPAGEKLAAILVACLCNEQGEAVFTAGDVAALQTRQADVIDRVAKECMKLNGMQAAEDDGAKNA